MVEEKYEFIQILIYLRNKMKCQEDAKIIQDMIIDLLDLNQQRIKEN